MVKTLGAAKLICDWVGGYSPGLAPLSVAVKVSIWDP